MLSPVQFVGDSAESFGVRIAHRKTINLFPIVDASGIIALIGTPGSRIFCDLNGSQIRAHAVFDGYLWAICDNTLYKINDYGIATSIGTINSSTGKCYIEDNLTQMMIVDGTTGYICDGSTVTEITDTDFPGAGHLTYQNGHFIIVYGGVVYHSEGHDGTSWLSGDVGPSPDDKIAVISDHSELFTFGPKSGKVYYYSGDSDFAFAEITGSSIEVGIAAVASLAKGDNSIFWLANDGTVRRAVGYQPAIISNDHLNYQISNYSTLSDAQGSVYSNHGHTFYELTFPTENKTWVYDTSTQLWHQRSTGLEEGRHKANCHVLFNNKWYYGSCDSGKIYEMDMSTYTDDGESIRRVRRPITIHHFPQVVRFNRFELQFEPGAGLSEGQGSDPQCMINWSDDGGMTYPDNTETWASIGKIGVYNNRVQLRRLGSSINREFGFTITDPVKCVLTGAYLDVSGGRT